MSEHNADNNGVAAWSEGILGNLDIEGYFYITLIVVNLASIIPQNEKKLPDC